MSNKKEFKVMEKYIKKNYIHKEFKKDSYMNTIINAQSLFSFIDGEIYIYVYEHNPNEFTRLVWQISRNEKKEEWIFHHGYMIHNPREKRWSIKISVARKEE